MDVIPIINNNKHCLPACTFAVIMPGKPWIYFVWPKMYYMCVRAGLVLAETRPAQWVTLHNI